MVSEPEVSNAKVADSEEDASLFNLLKWQSQIHEKDFRDALQQLNQTMVLGFTVLAASATLIFYYHAYPLAFGIPVIYVVTGLLALSTLGEMFALASYRDFLDLQISQLSRDACSSERVGVFVPWFAAAGSIRRYSIANLLLQLVFPVAGALGGYVSIMIGWIHMHAYWWVGPISLTVYSGLLIASWPAIVEALTTYEEVQQQMVDLSKIPRERYQDWVGTRDDGRSPLSYHIAQARQRTRSRSKGNRPTSVDATPNDPIGEG